MSVIKVMFNSDAGYNLKYVFKDVELGQPVSTLICQPKAKSATESLANICELHRAKAGCEQFT